MLKEQKKRPFNKFSENANLKYTHFWANFTIIQNVIIDLIYILVHSQRIE